MAHHQNTAQTVANAIADELASPSDVQALGLGQGWWPQSLAVGAIGVALLHIERARTGMGSWQRAHDWLACAAQYEVNAGPDSHLFYGAPALAFALHAAADRYARTLDTLDSRIASAAQRRLKHAHLRMDRGDLPALAEFDTIRGLAGIAAYLLRRDPNSTLTSAILTYMVRLTEPVANGDDLLPGWWSSTGPAGTSSPDFPGGHANNGMAHGIGGPLAVLSLALRLGIRVDGQAEAITRICAWLDQWRQSGAAGARWPYWITRSQLRDGRLDVEEPNRPSWCYGTGGLARAQQLAALALGDGERLRQAELALLGAFADPRQLEMTTDLSLCHGYAGLAQIAGRAAADSPSPDRAAELSASVSRLLGPIALDDIDAGRIDAALLRRPGGDFSFLEGAAGVALALHSAQVNSPPVSGWDACLLIT